MMEPAIKNFQKTNPNDIYFIQKLSYLVKDKANDLVEMQDREKYIIINILLLIPYYLA